MNIYRLSHPMAIGVAITLALLVSLDQGSPSARSPLNTLHVSHDCSSIPNCYDGIGIALSASNAGDIIRIARGIYTETITINKSVSLEGGWNERFTIQDPEANVTTLDAQRTGPVIRVEGRVSPSIEGLVITGGDATNSGGRGGGIRIAEAGQVTIRHNVIVDNIACNGVCQGRGGGLAIHDSSAIVVSNTIASNVAQLSEGEVGLGGGIFVGETGNALVVSNRILTNTASLQGAGKGGGVYADGIDRFQDNLLQGNSASEHGDGTGGGVFVANMAEMRKNTIVDNRAQRGGGVYLSTSSNALRVQENLFARNSATGSGQPNDGGGGVATEDDDVIIINNQFISNTAEYFGGGLLLAGGTTYLVRQNIFESNEASYGGGVFVYSSTGTLDQNWIISNTAITRGGGLYLYADGVPQVDGNRVLDNKVTEGDGGGVCIRNNNKAITLTNQIIARNQSSRDGDGVHISFGKAIYLYNNTLADNGQGDGTEGITLLEGSRVTLTNNILIGHGIGITVSVDSTANLDFNDFYDNYIATIGASWGPNHLAENPQFVNRVDGDYHLRSTSPVVDNGDPTVAVPRDFEWDPRPSGAGIDVGADEVSLHVYLAIVLRDP